MKFPSPLLSGTLIKRYRRSLADIKLDTGQVVTAHVFSLGPMTGCCEPGRPVLVSDSADRSRRHPLTWELINMDGVWVGVNPNVSRKAVHEAIVGGAIESFQKYHIESAAVYGRRKRVDFILQNMDENCFINLHSVSWVEKGRAMFPDAVSEFHRKALHDLAEIAKQGHRAIALFHVLRGDCDRMSPARDVDSKYFKAANDALRAGVEMMVFRAAVSPLEISLGVPIPFSTD